MKERKLPLPKGPVHLPRLGQRIIKTAVAVFICLLINSLIRGQEGNEMSMEAIITAIICIQPHVRDSRYSGVNRFFGSLIGIAWSMFILLILIDFPVLSRLRVVMYAVMTIGLMGVLYTSVACGLSSSAGLAAIVYSCVIMVYPDIENPLYKAGIRMLDILIGTAVAVTVNGFHLPRRKNRDRVFFLRARDLVPDRFSSIPSAVLFHLNSLIADGAKIVLISEHAPAFFTLQLSAAQLNAPIITIDGAAIYDMQTNEFLYAEPIPAEVSSRLRRRLDAIGCSCFIYTIHKNKLCIFHQGRITEQEQVIYERMRGSPYRSYLEGEIYEPDEIVCFKLITTDGMVAGMEAALQAILNEKTLRAEIRPQTDAPGISALYLYSAKATVTHAQNVMMWMLREQNPAYRMEEIYADHPYRSEMDALRLLRTLGNAYEPLFFMPKKD